MSKENILGEIYALVGSDKRKRTGKTITKGKDGKIVAEGNEHSFFYTWRKLIVDAAGKWLEWLLSKRDRVLIVGTPAADWPKGEERRRLKKHISDSPCFLIPIDVDKVSVELEGDLTDGENVALQVMALLGIDESAQGFWHLTSSHLLPGKGSRARLYIVLDEPLRPSQMKKLAEALWKEHDELKVDFSLYSSNQEIFVTDPEFDDDVDDPMDGKDRSGPLPGAMKWKPPADAVKATKRKPGRPRKAQFDKYVEALKATGKYIEPGADGTHYIDCLYEIDHTKYPQKDKTDTVYMEAGTNGYARPRLYCQHDGCKERDDYHGEYVKALGLDRDLTYEDFRFVATSGTYVMLPIMTNVVPAGINAMLPWIRDGEEQISPAKHIERRNQVTTLTWAPGRELILEAEAWTQAGPINREGLSSLNTFIASQYVPPWKRDAAEEFDFEEIKRLARRWIAHVIRVFPDDWEHILNVLAFKVQNPGIKVNHCLVFDGIPRIGKDSILVPVFFALGHHNCESVSPAEMTGQFNKYERCVLCLINESSDSGGERNKYQFYEHTKAMIASPPLYRRINEKHLGEHYVPNTALFVITTNDAKASLYIPAADGRYHVASSRITRREDIDKDGYFERYYWWLYEDGGMEAVADYLHALDVSRFNPTQPPPRTQAWHGVVGANNSDDDVDLARALDKLGWPDVIRLTDVTDEMPRWEYSESKTTALRSLVFRLNRLENAYVMVANETVKDGVWKVRGQRVSYYARRALTIPERINAVKRRIEADRTKRRDADDDAV